MNTNVDATPMEWAISLTREELIKQLKGLVSDPHRLTLDERNAVITVAVTTLDGTR